MKKKIIVAVAISAALTGCDKAPKAEYERQLTTPKTTTVVTTTSTTSTSETTTSTSTTTETITTETTTETETDGEGEAETTQTEALQVTEIVTSASSMWVSNEYEATFYVGRMMGYTSQPCGASGELLTSGYSVASNYFPFGTKLYIESDYISGEFIVQDCGGMADNVIDFYFWDISEVPEGMAQVGRFPITVSVIN